jgi:hypothetical protein
MQPHKPLHRTGRCPLSPARHGARVRWRAQGIRRERCAVGRAKRARAWRRSAALRGGTAFAAGRWAWRAQGGGARAWQGRGKGGQQGAVQSPHSCSVGSGTGTLQPTRPPSVEAATQPTTHIKPPHRPLHRTGRPPPPPARRGACSRQRAHGVGRERCKVERANKGARALGVAAWQAVRRSWPATGRRALGWAQNGVAISSGLGRDLLTGPEGYTDPIPWAVYQHGRQGHQRPMTEEIATPFKGMGTTRKYSTVMSKLY